KSLAKLARFPDLFDGALLARARTFREFDDLFTAPLHGFRDAPHYWSSSSSGAWLGHIRVPTLVINARNDPFLPDAARLAPSTAPRPRSPCAATGGSRGPSSSRRSPKA